MTAPNELFPPDPLRQVRILKRIVQLGVYMAIPGYLVPFRLLLDMSYHQLTGPLAAGLIIATVAIEGAFWQFFKLRKQSAYPNILAVQLGAIQDLRQASDSALRLACHYLKASAAVLAWSSPAGRLIPVASRNMPEDWTPLLQHPEPDHPPIKRVLEEQAIALGKPSECPCWSGLFDDDHVVAYVPLRSLEQVTAVLCLVGPRRRSELRDSKLLESIGYVIGLALENLRLSHRQYESIMQVLCRALDMRDSDTQGHSQRVAQLAGKVARQLNLPDNDVKRIEQAAALHDIGKIGVADAILSKPGALSEDEWAEMRRHPSLGHQMLDQIEGLSEVAEIVYSHHERFDGRGYPRGLGGDALPLGARIFAVVDTYDAITSDRPYRRARRHEEAMEEILRNSGTQFDPRAVAAFLELERTGQLAPHADHEAFPAAAQAAVVLAFD